jgi:hypothetical protein
VRSSCCLPFTVCAKARSPSCGSIIWIGNTTGYTYLA